MADKEKRKVLLLGIEYFKTELLRAIVLEWDTIAVDIDDRKIKKFKEEKLSGVEYLVGDASSILTWKKINVHEIFHIITTIRDIDINLEVCRIVREAFELDTPISLLSYIPGEEKRFGPFNVSIVNPMELGINFVLNKLEKNYIRASEIGLRKGEIIEVPILYKSHLVGRHLQQLNPSKWRVAAIYRNGQMIIPTGISQIEVKDRVVLVGDPIILENVANTLLRGEPNFPLEFGSTVIFPLNSRYRKNLDELIYIKQFLQIRKLGGYSYLKSNPREEKQNADTSYEILGKIDSLLELFELQNDIGMTFIPIDNLSFWESTLLKAMMQKSCKPFLLSRGTQPYKNLITSLNCSDPACALELSMDISLLLNISIQALYVIMPEELRDSDEENMIKERTSLISDFESIYKKKIGFNILEGNPVKETIRFTRNTLQSLLLLLYSKKDLFSVWQPHVQYHIAKKNPLSTLLIPVESTYES